MTTSKEEADAFVKSFEKKIERIKGSDQKSGKNDHYVPQFLLRNFGIKDAAKKPEEIFEYTRGSLRPERNKIKDVASESGYYDVKSRKNGEADNLADRIHTEAIEGPAVPIIRKLETANSGDVLNNKEWNILGAFVSALYVGTPSFRSQLKHFLIYLLENNLAKMEDFGKDDTLTDIFHRNIFNIEIDDLRAFRPSKHADIDFFLKTHLVVISSLISAHLSEQIFRRDLAILESSAPDFLINDNPVFAFDEKEKIGWPFGFDFKDNQDIYLPISPRRCLCFTQGEMGKSRPLIVCPLEGKNKMGIDLINCNLFYRAEERVYFYEEREDIQQNLNQTKKLHNYNFC